MQKIIPHLWFDKQAEEAVSFYTRIFKDGKTLSTTRYTEAGKEIHGQEPGSVMTVEFEIEGWRFVGLNGGPYFKFTPAISFMVSCASKKEVDEFYGHLSEGGMALMPLDSYPFSERYAWVQDRFGVTWQLIYRAGEAIQQKITPSLMFANTVAGKAEEAMKFYTSLFENSKIGAVARYGAGQEPNIPESIMYADFFLAGQMFAAMDSAMAHEFTFNEAISLLITCKDQAEIDALSNKLSAVPESEQCGWVKDKFGVSWQIVPEGMSEMLNDPDRDKATRAMNAVMGMKRLDIAAIRAAFEGK